jgi:hypothetical protein
MGSRRQTRFARGAFAAAAVWFQAASGSAQQAPAPDVSPHAAALTVLHAEGGGAGDARAAQAARSASTRAASSQAEAKLTVTADVPGLEHLRDGSYRYHGANFTALISAEGLVQFRDKYFGFSKRMRPLTPVSGDGLRGAAGLVPPTPPAVAVQFKMDLYAWVEHKLGNDPYLSERRWFLERTRELREELASSQGEDALMQALLHIWSDASLSVQQRKQNTFDLWDQTAQDERGEKVRAEISAFIRERCPEDSACAYGALELQRLNRHRSVLEPFAPYAPQAERTSGMR